MAKLSKKLTTKAQLTETQARWLTGEYLLGVANAHRGVDEAMEALSLLSNSLGQCEALWQAHGDEGTHFWKPGLDQPITRDKLRDHENDWLFSAEGDDDEYGGESFFIWKFYDDEQKAALWAEHPEPALYHWEPVLRRPIPKGASVDAAMVMFADPLQPVRF